jgi:hypothetical protein
MVRPSYIHAIPRLVQNCRTMKTRSPDIFRCHPSQSGSRDASPSLKAFRQNPLLSETFPPPMSSRNQARAISRARNCFIVSVADILISRLLHLQTDQCQLVTDTYGHGGSVYSTVAWGRLNTLVMSPELHCHLRTFARGSYLIITDSANTTYETYIYRSCIYVRNIVSSVW